MSLLAKLQSKHQGEAETTERTAVIAEVPEEKGHPPLTTKEAAPALDPIKPKKQKKERKQVKAEKVTDEHKELKDLIFKHILKERQDEDVEEIIADLDGIIEEIFNENEDLNAVNDLSQLKAEITNDLTGYGPINPLLLDEEVTEVMVNGPQQVYAERGGRLELTDITFRDNDHVMAVLEKIVAPLGRRVDESSPMVDARLKDGSRVNAIIPPLALGGPTITIRKFSKDPFTIHDLIKFGTLTEEMAAFIKACVEAKLNIFVSGGTGSGKTTTLNVLSSFISNKDRIVTIEDAAELQLGQEHVVSLETRPPNIEGKGSITIRDLVRNSLRMRPDRIVIGEVRSGEALDMLQAMNTGHDGSLATGHSNSPRDMVARLETMVLMAGMELPIKAIREQIAGALDVIIQQSRLKDGSRRITNITEVQGLEGDIIVLQDIFTFKQFGVDDNGKIIGKLVPTGVRPKFYERMEYEGIHLPASIFMEKGE
ncbi:type II secretion system protein E [Thalassobacillus devorans]|uniref:Type II secretion system protein E n=1 Tax=Thalassobacillus devorans TaxID=279813 RepID=A0ABQ1PNY7_9BACI|nr:CpaF family protein [Thalassobacillus devorans]NIK30451.1 pilus assembly protein CpaF [Thalassobacillus devorans]GGD00182.1 type II secretion system protein E [Thalassobacillus devorans]